MTPTGSGSLSTDQGDSAPRHFRPDEEQLLGRHLQADEALTCPLCEVSLDVRPIPKRTDVSYVRDRVLVACPVCHRTSVLDRREVR